jgi:hypothetical protein
VTKTSNRPEEAAKNLLGDASATDRGEPDPELRAISPPCSPRPVRVTSRTRAREEAGQFSERGLLT